MRFAAILGVKDEVQLIEQCIDHLWTIGVSSIVAFDMGSTDGTLQILEQRCSPVFSLLRFDDRDPDTGKTFSGITRAAQQIQADWVLFLDADEFWLPASGRLADCEALREADVVQVRRFNVPLGIDGPLLQRSGEAIDLDRTLLITQPMPDFRRELDRDPALAWIRAVPVSKVLARPHAIAGMHEGLHDVVAPAGTPVRRQVASDVVIAHVPLSTEARFARKVDNIRAQLAIHAGQMKPETAWHWRRWLDLADQGRIDQEFRRSIFDEDTIASLRSEGVIQSVAGWLEASSAAAAP